ncbi:hypothetical protein PYCCODRAFT_1442304 [Trametes coccinea BRFM310]|uniref:Transmembrane protein n=1 Tax=Trametes coccinea (strain BRFM310) TaxID=1353009 RepID=A0A1Y2J035_TRAC3|nr:hypothetical protein PYCCODRAFT_1442304 [Trametes coccinea BRFM310]
MSSTQHSATHSHAMRFPSVGLEVLSAVVHFLGVSVLSFLLAKKVHWPDVSSLHGLSRISWPRLLVILNVIDSWLFLFSTGLLVNGTGMELSETVCLLGILNCIAFYATSKILIYMFLVEKVYVVWSGVARKKRLRSPVYLTCLGVVSLYVGVGIYMIIGRVAYFREDGSCVIGLTRSSSLVLLTYDLFVNIFLTSLFVWPLFNRKFYAPRIRRVAIRTLWAATVALTTSCINILVLTIMHGKQLGWVCLASCGTDVVINSAVLCWVTSGSKGSQGSSDGSRNVSTKELDEDEHIIDCSQVSAADTSVMRRRARSEPPRPSAGGRTGRLVRQLSRLFERRHGNAPARERDVEQARGEKSGGAVVEGMYEHAPGPLLPMQAYKSMLKRSNQSLRQHLNDSQVAIHVTETTEVVMDEIPLPRAPKSKRRQRKPQEEPAQSQEPEGDGTEDQSKP